MSDAESIVERRLRRANRALRVVGAIHDAQQRAADVSAFLDDVCRELVRAGRLGLAWVGLAEPGPERRVVPVARHGAASAYVDELCITYDDSATGRGPTGTAIRTGAPVKAPRIAADPSFSPWRERALQHDLASTASIPFAVDGEVVGALVLYAYEPDAFDHDELEALVEVARAVASGYGALRARAERQRAEQARDEAEAKLQRLNAELEARVARRTEELAALYEHAPCGYHSIDAAGRVVRMNETELRWLGRAREDVVGVRALEELVAPEDREALREALAALGPAPAVTELEVALERADASRIGVLLSASRDPDDPGTTHVTAFDLTARRAAQKAVREREEAVRQSRDELSAANAALERSARAKDEFLASMSHELRTPLNAILGLSEAFQDEIYGPVGEPQLRALKRIEESGRHLLSLINDILDLSKVEAGQVTLDRQPTSLDDVCRASLRMVQEAAQKKRIGVSYSIDDGLAILLADERALKQILVNLLSNAVKFTREDGAIGLEVTTSPEDETCTFSVWDTGIGIAVADQGRLFRPFVQLDSSLARHHAGTGLGLALVRRLVELHGGGIRVESAPDVGSRFTVVVPWQRATRGDEPPAPTRAPAPRPRPAVPRARVLLAEDDATNVALVSDFFDAHGIDLTVARNGYEAISLANEKVPDLILMDIQMPLLDGIAALRAIRQSASPEVRRIPVIAVTALAMPGDRERCRDAGADDYLTKPLRLRHLLEAIEARVPPPSAR